MKAFAKTLLAATLAAAVAGGVQADDKVLHVYNWSDYIAPDTLAKFEKESGIKVVYDVYDSNETLEAKLLAGKSGYDVVLPSNNFLAKQIKAKVYQPLDKAQLPNWKNLNQDLLKTVSVSDPGNQYAPVDSWDLLFKPENIEKLKGCGVSFLDSPTEMLPIALHYLGYPTDSQDPKQLKEAEALFLKIRPAITYFHSSKYISDLANGNVCVAVGYSGDIKQAKSRAEEAKGGVTVGYNIPKEGAGSFFDMLAVPADAANPKGALAFINFLMKPEIIAEITNNVQFPNANAAATPLVDEALRNDPGVYPSAEVTKKLYTAVDLPAKVQRVMTRSWTKIKSGK